MFKNLLFLVLIVGVLGFSGCAQGVKLVKDTDQLIQDNLW